MNNSNHTCWSLTASKGKTFRIPFCFNAAALCNKCDLSVKVTPRVNKTPCGALIVAAALTVVGNKSQTPRRGEI